MAVGPIGAVTYANQATSAQSKVQSNVQNRLDMQDSVAAAIQDANKGSLEGVRPTEKTYKIDPEHEHEKEKKDQEQGKQEENSKGKSPPDKKNQDEEIITQPHLDIKA